MRYGRGHSRKLDAAFAALADPTRRAILARLAKGEATVGDLAKPFQMSQPAITKHLQVLERAGLISQGKDAQRRPRKLETKALEAAAEWIGAFEHFWTASFDNLETLLEEEEEERPRHETANRKTR